MISAAVVAPGEDMTVVYVLFLLAFLYGLFVWWRGRGKGGDR